MYIYLFSICCWLLPMLPLASVHLPFASTLSLSHVLYSPATFTHAYTLNLSKSHAFQPHTILCQSDDIPPLIFHLNRGSHCHNSIFTEQPKTRNSDQLFRSLTPICYCSNYFIDCLLTSMQCHEFIGYIFDLLHQHIYFKEVNFPYSSPYSFSL